MCSTLQKVDTTIGLVSGVAAQVEMIVPNLIQDLTHSKRITTVGFFEFCQCA